MVLAHGYEPAYTGPKTLKIPLIIHRITFVYQAPPLFAKTAGKSILFEPTRFRNDQRVETITAMLSTKIMNVIRPSAIH